MLPNGITKDGQARRRSRLEIQLDVLRIIYEGEHAPTHLMTTANLSWDRLQRNLRSLVSKGLIREIDVSGDSNARTRRCYEITQKGREVVRYFGRAREFQELVEV